MPNLGLIKIHPGGLLARTLGVYRNSMSNLNSLAPVVKSVDPNVDEIF